MASMVVNPTLTGLGRAQERLVRGRENTVAPLGLRTMLPPEGRRPGHGSVEDLSARDGHEQPAPTAHSLTAPPIAPASARDATGTPAGAQATVPTAEQQRLAELAVSCLLGDSFAWEALVRSQQRRVYGLCYRFTGSASAAEDLTQEVFLKVYRNLRSFDPLKASFGVWLTTLTRNLLVDHYRRSRMDRASESLDVGLGGDDDGPTRAERLADHRGGQERHVAGIELRARIQAALAQVSPELREAVILRDLEDMDYREIAEALCIPQGTVKSRISRGRAELARLLKGMEGQVV